MKKYRSFTAGVVATLMAVSTVGTALAASSRVEYNKAGISLFGENKVLTGESYKAPNGQDVPSVITYVDETGGKTNYLSIRQISELLGIEVRWDGQKNRVNLGADPADYVVVGGKEDDGSIPANATKPVLGTVHGPFTEIDPAKAVGKSLTGVLQDNTKVQTTCGYSLEGTFYPEDGQYIVLTVTNNGSATQTVTAGRALTLGGFEKFTSFDIGAGETLTRAFTIADGAEELESTLAFGVYAKGVSGLSDITVSLKQYKSRVGETTAQSARPLGGGPFRRFPLEGDAK